MKSNGKAVVEHDGLRTPRTGEELAAWVRDHLSVEVSARALLDGHAAPLDYIAWSFFEGCDGFEDEGQSERSSADAVVWANRGGGKTFLGALATLLDLVFKPGIEVRILAGSLEQAGRMHEHLRSLCAAPIVAPMIEGRVTDKRVALANGSRAELLAQSQASVRGTRVQKLRCDEVELFDPLVWSAAQLTTRSRTVTTADGLDIRVRGSVQCLSTMHIPHGLMFELVRQARVGKRTLFKWGVVDALERCGDEHACRGPRGRCPLFAECGGRAKTEGVTGHIPVSDALDLKGRVDRTTWESEMLCLRPKRTDAVLPEFNPALHVTPAPEGALRWPLIGGMDFGFRGETVVLLARAEPGQGARVWVERERVAAGVVVDEHASWIAHASPVWVGIDPAGVSKNDQTGVSNRDVLAEHGVATRAARRGLGVGLRLLRARLAPADERPPTLLVSPSCTRLIEALERYHYPEDRPESTKPVKDGPDHAVDALRYMIQNLDAPGATRAGSYIS
ncbi:MAG: hypothetical protein AAGG07_07530 [Planctomycetota bacterium]